MAKGETFTLDMRAWATQRDLMLAQSYNQAITDAVKLARNSFQDLTGPDIATAIERLKKEISLV